MNAPLPSRRELLSLGLALAGGGALLSSCAEPPAEEPKVPETGPIYAGEMLLFQGDSITDAERERYRENAPSTQGAIGAGYAWKISDALLKESPEKRLRIYNRGVSGDKVFQLAHRWNRDTIEMAPDVLSILVGVNDFWHTKNTGYDGTAEVYEKDYDALLARTREALPKVRLVIGEPFVLRCGAVDDSWFPAFDDYRAAAQRVAEKHGAVWVPYQAKFDEACKSQSPEHWASDGVHPTDAGCELMAEAWLESVRAAWA